LETHVERADFIHLVRLSEQASAQDSQTYRRNVAIFSALGYLWVLGCFVLAVVLLVVVGSAVMQGKFRFFYVWLLVAAAGLFWSSLRSLWCRLDPPEGETLTAADAPALFEALERIRKKIKGPPIHHVRLNSEFNASISQVPRWGLFGGAVNHLTIGLPMLLAVDRPRFLAVLAHEYGHLRGDHGQFAAWIYRTRLSWMKLSYSMRHDQGPVAAATQAFLNWYFPRFLARTFALARQDEYEADRIAGKLLGPQVAGAALTEIAIKSNWMATHFWPRHWAGALGGAQALGPFTALHKLLSLPPDRDFAEQALRQTLKQISDVDDTHPVLRDRLEAMHVKPGLPSWSSRPALDLLGARATQWLSHFDKQWCRDNAADWRLHHSYLNRVRSRVATLTASAARNNANEMAELGDLHRRLGELDQARPCYERALKLTPGHAAGLRGLVQCLGDADHDQRMDSLRELYEHSQAYRWWACRMAVQALEKRVAAGGLHDAEFKQWRTRLQQADEAENRAQQEITETPFFHAISRHDLNEFELGELVADLARCKPVRRAWLVNKVLKEFAYRRCYLLFIELPGMDDEDRYHLCRSLERSLDLPGSVLVLWAGHSPTLQDIQRHAFSPVYVRTI
jgi:Zn-dependent protease with chaperone function